MDNHRTVWSEGMFLSPQHFQQQERYLESYSRQLVALASGQPMGFATLVIDQEQLAIGRLMVRRCSGIFPDGTPFHTDSAIVRSIDSAEPGSLLYLALPALRPGTVDTAPEQQGGAGACRYLSFDQNIYDSSDRDNDPVSVTLARLNLKLLLADEEPDMHIRLPVVRIQEKQADGRLLLDPTFIPRCLDYRSSPFLQEQVQNLQARMRSRASAMATQIGPLAQQKSVHTLQLEYLWLQALNRHSARLDSIATGEALRPGELYRELVSMAADLATFTTTLAPEFPPYNPDDPYRCFAPALTALQQNLRQARSEKITALEWDDSLFERRRLLRTRVEDRTLFNDGRFILAVTSALGPSKCREQFPASAKLAGHQHIAALVRSALSAVPLLAMQVPPLELKARPDTVYFEVDTSHELWQELINSHDAVALHVDEQMTDDLQITLYVVR